MSENRISVKAYLDNKELLSVKGYIPYASKVLIVDAIMKEVSIKVNGTYNLDSVLLDRIKTQIFIESCTNLDLSIIENELDGYDMLMLNDAVDALLNAIEYNYKELDRILQLRVDDYIRDKASVKGTLNYKIESVLDYFDMKFPSVIDMINGIDAKTVVETISNVLDSMSLSKKK